MLNLLQIFRKNASLFASKSMLMLLLATVVVFSEGCSKKMPCPDTAQVNKDTKKSKKKKVVKAAAPADADGADNAEASAAPAEEESGGTAAKAKISVKKNRYNKSGLLQKKNYKSLRSNPARKTSRVKKGFFSKLFGGGSSTPKTKSKVKSKQNVGPVDE
jgi:hypothetical protein